MSTEPGSARARRLAKNEAFFRETNELLERDAVGLGGTFDCICECSVWGCVERLDVTRAEYERVRSHGDRFVVAPGHDDPTIETVVERHPAYLVVEKHGLAGAVARSTDPR